MSSGLPSASRAEGQRLINFCMHTQHRAGNRLPKTVCKNMTYFIHKESNATVTLPYLVESSTIQPLATENIPKLRNQILSALLK